MVNESTPIGILAYRRPKHLQRSVESVLPVRGHRRLYISIDAPSKHASPHERKQNAEVARIAVQFADSHPNICIFHRKESGGIIEHAFYLSWQMLRNCNRQEIILLEDDHLLTDSALDFFEDRFSSERSPHKPLLTSGFSREEHTALPSSKSRSTAYPILWSIGINRVLLRRAYQLWRGGQVNWLRVLSQLSYTRSPSTSVLASLYYVRTLQIGVRSRNHFDALVTTAILASGQRVTVPSKSLVADIGGGIDSYSERSISGIQLTCDSSGYTVTGTCATCERRWVNELANRTRQRLMGKGRD